MLSKTAKTDKCTLQNYTEMTIIQKNQINH